VADNVPAPPGSPLARFNKTQNDGIPAPKRDRIRCFPCQVERLTILNSSKADETTKATINHYFLYPSEASDQRNDSSNEDDKGDDNGDN